MSDKKYLIVIGGPTASGKTGIAIKLAQHFNTEILSADSRQFYKEMKIGTAKPSSEELAAAKHHLIDNQEISNNYSVGDFERDALKILDTIFQHNSVAILAGGSGMFIKALCEGLDRFPAVPNEVRVQLKDELAEKGIEVLQNELKEKDPTYYAQVDIHNQQRIIRALEICRATGKSFSSFRTNTKVKRIFTPIFISLHHSRSRLYDRINSRVDLMIKEGLIEEVKQLIPFKNKNALQTVGYQELFDHFDEKHDLSTAIELIKRNSRRYAKRQMTWFRRDPYWMRFHPNEMDRVLKYIQLATKENIFFSRASPTQFEAIQFFYTNQGYNKTINEKDQVLIAKKDDKIIGALRFCKEAKGFAIRGVYVDSSFHQMGIASQLIHEGIAISNDSPLYLLCSKDLEPFYNQFGFKTTISNKAPRSLQERLSMYQQENPNMIMMKMAITK